MGFVCCAKASGSSQDILSGLEWSLRKMTGAPELPGLGSWTESSVTKPLLGEDEKTLNQGTGTCTGVRGGMQMKAVCR